ncbi:MAG: tetratricopeptide repeat protein [Candidatus Riflebacteria bacterium]|nr:tetratricopeptide repeat protein [Candidatus Riflebacteria bacterium]
MGKFFHATGRFFESLEAFTRAAEIKPNYFDVGERLDELQDYFHRLFTLITMHQELLRAHPNYPDLHYKMGNLYRMVGKRQEAEAEFKEALKLNAKYDLARSALQDLQATPLYTIGATNIVLEKAQASASAEPVENFQIELELSEFVDSPRAAKILGQCLVRVKNIRTGRILEKVLPPDIMSGKTVLLDCTRLGTIALNDTLLVQLFDQTTNTILNGLPHSVSEGEIQRRLSRIGISPLFEVIFADKTFTPPVRYFLVNFQSKDLADSIAGQNARYSAHLVNTNSGASCIGTVNEENPAEINFVLMAMGNEDVVHLGDKLRFKIQDKKANTIFSMDFPVAQVDIENFSKSVAFETPERDGEPVRPPRGSVDVAMESSSSDDGRTIIKKG